MAPMAQIASAVGALVARQQSLPTEYMALKPAGMDDRSWALLAPAMTPTQAPVGSDMTMTVDGPDQVWYLVVAITCIAMSGLFLIVRVYTKLAVVRSFELADWFIFASFPLIVVEIGLGYQMVKWGSGVHQWQVTLDQLFHQLYWANIAQIVYCPLSFAVKMAILLQYLRLFAPSRQVNRTMWYGAWFMIVSCSILYTVLVFWTAFYCYPRKAIWDKLTPGLKCHDVNDITLVQGAFNMVSDIIILLLPTAGLWKLNVPLGRKIAVTILFATGLLACIASAMRIVFTVKIAPVYNEADVSHNALFIGLWTEAEVSLGFLVACALCLPKLIQAKAHRIKRAVSKASSPFASLKSNGTRSGTFNMGSRKGTKLTSIASVDSIQMNNMDPPRPAVDVRKAPEQNSGRLDTNAFRFPAASVASSTYSAHNNGSRNISRDPSPGRLTPLHVPQGNQTGDFDMAIRSPTHRSTRDLMSPTQLQADLDALQQYRFEADPRESMEESQRGMSPGHAHVH
ncbi:hypothetical protein P280DRAFT_263164 [Massarina eburnea CBS 473.64]|uniref:Rhodopsin domain-containing protein n=1 Tax=Massarina eburnea CBS 473.64 TaxID=1395130 RepID=A0A6A6S359_9PLEO|nr:hypothetical protein P280DRAFT_263164 [Massarina eburnea CBS 473.64]